MKTDSNYDIIAAITRQIDVEHQTPADEKFYAFLNRAVSNPKQKAAPPAVHKPVELSNNDIIMAITRQIDVEHQTPADENFYAFLRKAVKTAENAMIGAQASTMQSNNRAIDSYKAFSSDEYSA